MVKAVTESGVEQFDPGKFAINPVQHTHGKRQGHPGPQSALPEEGKGCECAEV